MIIVKLFIILITFSFIFVKIAEAEERIRFYNSSGGWAKPTYNYADKQSDGSYRFYDSKGRYKGRMDKDRFIENDGKVIEKYYLFRKR